MNGWGVAGIVLQLAGTVLAGHALYADWHAHGGGKPLVPLVPAVVSWVRRRLGLARRQVVIPGATGSGSLVAAPGVAIGQAPVPEDAAVEEQLRYLRRRLEFLSEDSRGLRNEVGRVEQSLRQRVSEVAVESQQRDTALSERISDVATGSVREELIGLVLVGIGSILSAFG